MARIEKITSTTNPKFQTWKSLLSSKGIKKEGLFILSGEKLVREFLKTDFKIKWSAAPGSHEKNPLKLSPFRLAAEIVCEGLNPLQDEASVFHLADHLFRELDLVGTQFNLFILESPELPASQAESDFEGLEVVAPLGDPKNLGALIRSSVAFGVRRIHLTPESANPFHPQVVKASAGAVLRAPLSRSPSLQDWDRPHSWALDSLGEDLIKIPKPTKARIIIGEEGPGLPELKQVRHVAIPTQDVESLNATVAASLLLFAWR